MEPAGHPAHKKRHHTEQQIKLYQKSPLFISNHVHPITSLIHQLFIALFFLSDFEIQILDDSFELLMTFFVQVKFVRVEYFCGP